MSGPDEFGIEAPDWLLSQTETLVLAAQVDEDTKDALMGRLDRIRFRGELEAFRAELAALQPLRPVSSRPHPNDELTHRLAREK